MEFYDFPYIGNVIIPTDEVIFFRGVGIPPTSQVWADLGVLFGICLWIKSLVVNTCQHPNSRGLWIFIQPKTWYDRSRPIPIVAAMKDKGWHITDLGRYRSEACERTTPAIVTIGPVLLLIMFQSCWLQTNFPNFLALRDWPTWPLGPFLNFLVPPFGESTRILYIYIYIHRYII